MYLYCQRSCVPPVIRCPMSSIVHVYIIGYSEINRARLGYTLPHDSNRSGPESKQYGSLSCFGILDISRGKNGNFTMLTLALLL